MNDCIFEIIDVYYVHFGKGNSLNKCHIIIIRHCLSRDLQHRQVSFYNEYYYFFIILYFFIVTQILYLFQSIFLFQNWKNVIITIILTIVLQNAELKNFAVDINLNKIN